MVSILGWNNPLESDHLWSNRTSFPGHPSDPLVRCEQHGLFFQRWHWPIGPRDIRWPLRIRGEGSMWYRRGMTDADGTGSGRSMKAKVRKTGREKSRFRKLRLMQFYLWFFYLCFFSVAHLFPSYFRLGNIYIDSIFKIWFFRVFNCSSTLKLPNRQ